MLVVVVNGDSSDFFFFFFLMAKFSHDGFVLSLIYDEPIKSIEKMNGLRHM